MSEKQNPAATDRVLRNSLVSASKEPGTPSNSISQQSIGRSDANPNQKSPQSRVCPSPNIRREPPPKYGGEPTTLDNLQTLCPPCNSRKVVWV